MKNFKKGGGSFGGGEGGFKRGGFHRPSFGGNGGSKPPFQKRSFGGAQGFDKPMHQATCSECGNSCEVPFRPMNGKPVFCRDCFASQGGAVGAERAPRRDFGDRPSAPMRPHFEHGSNNNGDVLKKLSELSFKIDQLAKAVEGLSSQKTGVQKVEKSVTADTPKTVAVPSKKVKATPKKKVAAKKKSAK